MKKGKWTAGCLLLLFFLLLTSCTVYPPPEPSETIETSSPPDLQLPSDTLPDGTVIAPSVDYSALAAEKLAVLPEEDMNEASFLLATVRKELFSPSFDEDEATGNRIDTALLLRNQAVEEKYNVHLIAVAHAESTILDSISSAVKTNLYFADLIELPYSTVGALADGSLTVNMNSLPFTDYTADYFDQQAIAQCSAGYYTYAIVGNANLHAAQNYCLYFNADLLSVDADTLYKAMYAGTWTWERLFALLDGKESAIILPSEMDAGELTLASGLVNLLESAYGALPAAAEDRSTVQAAAEIASQLLSVRSVGTVSDFLSGQSPFYVGLASEHDSCAPCTFSWGILPLPKISTEQTEYGTLGSYQTVFTAISSMSSPERTGMILQALNAASVGQTVAALTEDALRDSVRCADAATALGIAVRRCNYDLGYMFSERYTSIRRASVEAYGKAIAGEADFSSLYELQASELDRLNRVNFVWN